MVTIKLDRDDATELYWFFEALLRDAKVKEICTSAGLESQISASSHQRNTSSNTEVNTNDRIN